MNLIQQFLSRPGVQASEFKIALAITAWLGINADQHYVSFLHALIVAAPGIAYILSRGLAKQEVRQQQPPSSPPAA